MERSEATHVGVGSALLATGGIGLAILLPLTAAAKEGPWTTWWFLTLAPISCALGLTGFYMLTAVYTGAWLPRTALERRFTPRLVWSDTSVVRADEKAVVFRVGIGNEGRDNLDDAVVNLVVPSFVTRIWRSEESGERFREPGDQSTTPESLLDDDAGRPIASTSWLGRMDFPGRTYRVMFFRAEMDTVRGFPARVLVVGPALDEGFTHYFTVEADAGPPG